MYLFTESDEYVHIHSLPEKVICYGIVVGWVLNAAYILYFSSDRNYIRTEKEVQQAMSRYPLRWKCAVGIYIVGITAVTVVSMLSG